MGRCARHLILLRNSPWPHGPRTAEVVEAFVQEGGQVRPVSESDLRTFAALRTLSVAWIALAAPAAFADSEVARLAKQTSGLRAVHIRQILTPQPAEGLADDERREPEHQPADGRRYLLHVAPEPQPGSIARSISSSKTHPDMTSPAQKGVKN